MVDWYRRWAQRRAIETRMFRAVGEVNLDIVARIDGFLHQSEMTRFYRRLLFFTSYLVEQLELACRRMQVRVNAMAHMHNLIEMDSD